MQRKKDICSSRSYGQALLNYEDIEQATTTFASGCAEKLRRQASCARVVTVFLMTNKFARGPRYVNFKMTELPLASNNTPDIINAAVSALRQIFRKGYKYKKSGVIVSELVPEGQIQGNLWHDNNNPRTKKLMKVIDQINLNKGKGSVRYAVEGSDNKWHMRQEKLSRKYTTNWKDILTIQLENKK